MICLKRVLTNPALKAFTATGQNWLRMLLDNSSKGFLLVNRLAVAVVRRHVIESIGYGYQPGSQGYRLPRAVPADIPRRRTSHGDSSISLAGFFKKGISLSML